VNIKALNDLAMKEHVQCLERESASDDIKSQNFISFYSRAAQLQRPPPPHPTILSDKTKHKSEYIHLLFFRRMHANQRGCRARCECTNKAASTHSIKFESDTGAHEKWSSDINS
jgi:hypothetical protein